MSDFILPEMNPLMVRLELQSANRFSSILQSAERSDVVLDFDDDFVPHRSLQLLHFRDDFILVLVIVND